ncbi:MAG: hypothetical protein KDG55_13630, partial [Rhodocyclaceae bacterium]|nr:hypothetical protein [Rhodocyclaceae bacterium]
MTYPNPRRAARRLSLNDLRGPLARRLLCLLTWLLAPGMALAADRLVDAFDDRTDPAPWRTWNTG